MSVNAGCLAPQSSWQCISRRLNKNILQTGRTWGQSAPRLLAGTLLQPRTAVTRPYRTTAGLVTHASSDDASVQGHQSIQVTRSNFAATLPAVKQALEECQFFSFDCEMTGLFMPGMDDHAIDDVDDRYVKTVVSAEQFLVAQFGLSFFEWTGTCYEARSFNFHLFPSPNSDVDLRFTCQASALAFLASEGFDFNKMIYEGINFLPLSWRDKQLSSAAAAAAATLPSPDDLDDEEICFMNQLEEHISSWLHGSDTTEEDSTAAAAATGDGTGSALYLPAPPPQFAKLQQRLLAAGIGSSRPSASSDSSSSISSASETCYIVDRPASGSSSSSSSGVVLHKATAAECTAHQQFQAAHRAEQLTAATGFSQIFELIRDSRKPAVGHNIRFDLAYALASFIQSPLPKTWPGFKQLVSDWFPGGVYDTKYLAHCVTAAAAAGGGRVLLDTSLGTCYNALTRGDPANPQPLSSTSSRSSSISNLAAWVQDKTQTLDDSAAWQTLPAITHAPECQTPAAAAAADGSSSSSSAQSCAHEAGYDAFMTGAVFIGLMRLFEIEEISERSRWQQPLQPSSPPVLTVVQAYAWRQFFSRSKHIDYAALQGPDLVPNRPEVIYISKFSPHTRWIDIQKRLATLGLGNKLLVSMIRSNGYNMPPTGAYVIFPSGKQAQKGLQVIRQDKKWKVQVMSYSEYFFSKFGYGSSSSSGGSSEATVSRNPPAAVQAAAADDVSDSADAGDLVQQLQQKAAVARQRQQQQQQQQQAAAVANATSTADTEHSSSSSSSSSSSDASSSSHQGSNGSNKEAAAAAAAAATGSSLSQQPAHSLEQKRQQLLAAAAAPAASVLDARLKRPPLPPA